MAGKKDNAMVAVVSDLTNGQAAQLAREILKAKNKIAPTGRGTIAVGKKQDVGVMIQKGKQGKIARRQ